jgi:membrane protein DedA with SNARE-associated domain
MSAPELPGFLQSLAPTLDRHGYLAVGTLVLLEDFGVPVPGETVLIAAAVYAGAGRLNIVVVALIALAAAVLGDNIGYLIGRLGGRPLVERYGRYIMLTSERIEKATAFFERQGPKIVTIARFIEGLRQANGIISGMGEMPWRTFLAFNALGAAIWVGLWCAVGDLAGNHIDAIYRGVTQYLSYVIAAAIVAALVWLALRVRRRRARRLAGAPK